MKHLSFKLFFSFMSFHKFLALKEFSGYFAGEHVPRNKEP